VQHKVDTETVRSLEPKPRNKLKVDENTAKVLQRKKKVSESYKS